MEKLVSISTNAIQAQEIPPERAESTGLDKEVPALPVLWAVILACVVGWLVREYLV